MQTHPLPFQEWMQDVFGQDESVRFFDTWFESHEGRSTPELALQHLIRLFRTPEALEPFSLTQIGRGLWALAGCWDNGFGIARLTDVPMALREEFVDAIHDLYRIILEPRCEPVLSAGASKTVGNEVNGAAYMLWDVAPFCPGISRTFQDEPGLAALDERLTSILGSLLLEVRNPACQESILHGLGHGVYRWESKIQPLIDPFLARPGLDPNLAAYARSARRGDVL